MHLSMRCRSMACRPDSHYKPKVGIRVLPHLCRTSCSVGFPLMPGCYELTACCSASVYVPSIMWTFVRLWHMRMYIRSIVPISSRSLYLELVSPMYSGSKADPYRSVAALYVLQTNCLLVGNRSSNHYSSPSLCGFSH